MWTMTGSCFCSESIECLCQIGALLFFFPAVFSSRDVAGEFLPFLAVSKGKKLFARLLPFLKHQKALTLLRVVTTNLPTLMSRDSEEVAACVQVQFGMFFFFSLFPQVQGRLTLVLSEGKILVQCSVSKIKAFFNYIFFFLPTEALPVLYPSLRNVIGGLTFSQLINVLKDLTSVTSYESLTLACQNKVCSGLRHFPLFFLLYMYICVMIYFCVELIKPFLL